jgi:UDP-N-acetylmuramate: L-alanyl-gamma-D-glutamyl-meso-diaminopimelate ligase
MRVKGLASVYAFGLFCLPILNGMKVHFVSIGGSVMHQLAIALKRKGYQVSGSDDDIFEPSRTLLEKEGLLPAALGWNEAYVQPGLDAVILGMHARADNPELLKAQQLGLPIYSFPEYIYEESRRKTRIVVGGSHGKTTTTAMIMHVLKSCGHDFDYLVGARLAGFDQSVQLTDASVMVSEGDEYPASAINKFPKFHFLHPNIAILTGIAWDHINVFPTLENYIEQFRIFIGKIEKGGTLIYNETDPLLNDLVESNMRSDITYQAYGLPKFTVNKMSQTVLEIEGQIGVLKVFGNHNLLNIHAAYLACLQLGVRPVEFVRAISSFTGAARRLELLAATQQNAVFRDFAHAPSKVKATIEAVKQQYPDRRLVAVLELHTYSSLNAAFMPEYKGALDMADAACVFYSHHAMDIKKMPELSPETVLAGFDKENLKVATERNQLEDWLHQQPLKEANLVLMSSGSFDGLDITSIIDEIKK